MLNLLQVQALQTKSQQHFEQWDLMQIVHTLFDLIDLKHRGLAPEQHELVVGLIQRLNQAKDNIVESQFGVGKPHIKEEKK